MLPIVLLLSCNVHNIDMEPVCALLHSAGTVMAELSKVSRQDRGSDNCLGGHCEVMRGQQKCERFTYDGGERFGPLFERALVWWG